MPALLRGVARTDVVAGTARLSAAASSAGRPTSSRSETRMRPPSDPTPCTGDRCAAGLRAAADAVRGPPQQVYAAPRARSSAGAAVRSPPPAAPSQADVINQLKQLGELRDAGVLTEDEFAAQKAKLLG